MADPPSSAAGYFTTLDGRTVEIRDVWASNLEEEMDNIRRVIEDYPYVAMDTEFPGVVLRPHLDNMTSTSSDVAYQTLKCNVDMLKLIQLGLSFTDGEGNWAEGCTCWQFNFKFSLEDDIFATDSIELLKTSGIDFAAFENHGIDIVYFGELMMMSGLCLCEDVKWLTFHSGYDFGYLIKTLTCDYLPDDEVDFMDLLTTFFPCIYDVKYMMTLTDGLYGGLSALADSLEVVRVGPEHQAGSDSLLTAQTYFAMMTKHFADNTDDSKFRGELYGLGSNHTKYKSKHYGNSNNNSQNGGGPVMMQTAPGVHFGNTAHALYPMGSLTRGGSLDEMQEYVS
jgi:CCR4-NOT transcription complex subunit 7/8